LHIATFLRQRKSLICSINAASWKSFALPEDWQTWSIENGLHWKLDVQMREDECRIRGDGAEIFAVLRHIARNKLNQEKSYKRSVRGKQIKAALNDDYRRKVFEI
jgi:hypothetical protein